MTMDEGLRPLIQRLNPALHSSIVTDREYASLEGIASVWDFIHRVAAHYSITVDATQPIGTVAESVAAQVKVAEGDTP